jgi:SAM-dependent methyltransferase
MGAPDARSYFDALGPGEWERLEATLHGRVKYLVHNRFIEEYIAAGQRVLDAGSGPGRFAISMARRGARVTLLDISPGQVEAARARIAAAGCDAEAFVVGDVRDLSRFADASFDAVVCYGGAVSYACGSHQSALTELVRVCRPGGLLLVSVMSLWGTLMLAGTLDAESFLVDWDEHLLWRPPAPLPDVVMTRPTSNEFHLPMALFSARGLRRLLEDAGCDVLRTAAANPVSRVGLPLARITASDAASRQLAELELAMCEVGGLVDCGEHVVMVARKRD